VRSIGEITLTGEKLEYSWKTCSTARKNPIWS